MSDAKTQADTSNSCLSCERAESLSHRRRAGVAAVVSRSAEQAEEFCWRAPTSSVARLMNEPDTTCFYPFQLFPHLENRILKTFFICLAKILLA